MRRLEQFDDPAGALVAPPHAPPRALVTVRWCPRAEADHRRVRRQYAHVGHAGRRPDTICVARAFWRLPWRHRRGLIAHEVGHLLLGARPHRERDADRAVWQRFRIRVRYQDTRWGRRLQYA